MKGFESLDIETITVGAVEMEWFPEIAQAIIDTQIFDGSANDGSWPGISYVSGDQLVNTIFALLTLEKVAPPPVAINVAVDIHPTSCPNPLNVGGKGVMPVAILGTADFDITQIDPSSILLINANLIEPVGVSPLRWAMEDVAAPYVPGDEEPCYACTEEGPDGYLDLTLKFSMAEIVTAIGDVSDGDCLILTLTGNLMEEAGGTAITGEDVVRIIKK
jgi:hypothetical protein